MASDAPSGSSPELSDLKRLEALLKCRICYEFFKIPVITSCSHTFCSHCIRRYMQFKNQCPACFEETHENQLRSNRLIDEVVALFPRIKVKLTKALMLSSVASVHAQTQSSPREIPSKSPLKSDESLVKSSPVRTTVPEPSKPEILAGGNDVILNGIKVPSIFNSAPGKEKKSAVNTVICPVCDAVVSSTKINFHLDNLCLREPSTLKPAKLVKRSPLPKRLYHLMKDKELKKCMKDHGLNMNGDRKALISRIQKFTAIYNAENDAPNPRPVRELIAQLEHEESEEKKSQTLISSMVKKIHVDRKADPKIIEEANKAYREEQKRSFQELIENMRARDGRNIKPLKPAPRVYSDDECDPYRDSSIRARDKPSTSRALDFSSANDSDSDLIVLSDSEDKKKNGGAIDWTRTEVSDSDEDRVDPVSLVSTDWGTPVKERSDSPSSSEENKELVWSVYSLATQNPSLHKEKAVSSDGESPVKDELTNGHAFCEGNSSVRENGFLDASVKEDPGRMEIAEDDDSSIEMSFKPKTKSKSCNSTPTARGSKRLLLRQGPTDARSSPLRSFHDVSSLEGLRGLKEELSRRESDDLEQTPPPRVLRRRSKCVAGEQPASKPVRLSSRKKSKLELSPVY